MANQPNLLETRSLAQAVDKLARKTPNLFLERTFFSTPERHLSDVVDFETIEGAERMAIYGDPETQSNLVEQEEPDELRTFRIPYINEHKVLSSRKLMLNKNRFLDNGASQYVSTPAQLLEWRNQKIAREMLILINRIRYRRAWAAAQALQGGIQYKGKRTSFRIDFGFQQGVHRKKLVGNDAWTQNDLDMHTQLRNLRREVRRRCGTSPSICIMGEESVEHFLNNEKMLKKLDNNNYRIGSVDTTQESPIDGVELVAKLGTTTYYEFTHDFVDEDGQKKPMWPANLILLANPGAHSRLHYGPVIWEEEGMQIGEYAARQYPRKDPDGRRFDIASATVPIIHDADNYLLIETHKLGE